MPRRPSEAKDGRPWSASHGPRRGGGTPGPWRREHGASSSRVRGQPPSTIRRVVAIPRLGRGLRRQARGVVAVDDPRPEDRVARHPVTRGERRKREEAMGAAEEREAARQEVAGDQQEQEQEAGEEGKENEAQEPGLEKAKEEGVPPEVWTPGPPPVPSGRQGLFPRSY